MKWIITLTEVLQRLFRVPILLGGPATGPPLGEQNGLDPLAFLAKVMGILKSLKFHNFLKLVFTTFLVHVQFQKEFCFIFGMGF